MTRAAMPRILRAVGYIHPPITLLAEGNPAEVLTMLRTAAKPSQERLELREVFVQGRRYDITPQQGGFTMLTHSKAYWRYAEGILRVQRRTRATVQLRGAMSPLADAQHTRLVLHSHIRLGYLFDVLWIPLFFTSIVVFMPWAWWVIALVVVALFSLSYAYHYFNCATQANEMLFFIYKALQTRLVDQLPSLNATHEDILHTHNGFQQEWERFYKRQQEDTP